MLSCVAFALRVIDLTVGVGATADTTALSDTPPSTLAVMVTPPALSAATTPDELTLTMLPSDDTQFTVRPVSTFPFASFSVTVAWADLPTLIVGATLIVMLAAGVGAFAGAVTV